MSFYVPAPMRVFTQTTRFPDIVTDMDKRRGRALLIDGNVFYSPNSARIVPISPSVSLSPTHDISSLRRPVWWSLKYGHLAFIPTCEFGPHPLDDLISMPSSFRRTRKGVWLDTSFILSWNRLQYDLRRIIRILAERCHVPAFPDVIDSVLVSLGPYQSERAVREKVMEARGLFLYWVGQLAYVLALNISIDSNPPRPKYDLPPDDNSDYDWDTFHRNALPKWFVYLGERNWPQSLLSILHSCVADFTHEGRVGLFLNLIKPAEQQFSVDWFLQFRVPVWYPWGKAESDTASRQSSFSRFAPLPYQLQEVGTFLHKTPTVSVHSREHADVESPPWVAFFAKREVLNGKRLVWEKEVDKQIRLRREKQPPTASAKVFEWLKNSRGVYERIAIAKDDRTDTLAEYGKNQKRYDSFFNEWDCIEEMGEMDAEELENMQWDDEPILYDSSSEVPLSNPSAGSSLYEPPPPTPAVQKSSRWLSTKEELPEGPQKPSEFASELYEHCGFVTPLQVSHPQPPGPGGREGNRLSRALGLTETDEEYWSSSKSSAARNFVQAIQHSGDMPDAEIWDLARGNRLSLGMSKRLKYIRRIGPLFVFDFGHHATCQWKLAVYKPSIALWLCRLDDRLDERELSLELTRRGIAHRTLISLSADSICMPPSLPLPVRLPDYKFSEVDYKSYLSATKTLLRRRRVARVALMAGGIAWRLAVEQSFELVLDGPTYSLPRTRAGTRYPSSDSRREYWDDDCTVREMDQLCGACVWYNGMHDMYIFHCIAEQF